MVCDIIADQYPIFTPRVMIVFSVLAKPISGWEVNHSPHSSAINGPGCSKRGSVDSARSYRKPSEMYSSDDRNGGSHGSRETRSPKGVVFEPEILH